MEQKRHQFMGFVVILLFVGFLNYFRKLSNGYKFSKNGKILYLSTMVTFVIGIMFVLYYTNMNNIASFLIGLLVTTLSEHIAKLFMTVGDNFNPIVVKFIKNKFDVDLSKELLEPKNGKSHPKSTHPTHKS